MNLQLFLPPEQNFLPFFSSSFYKKTKYLKVVYWMAAFLSNKTTARSPGSSPILEVQLKIP